MRLVSYVLDYVILYLVTTVLQMPFLLAVSSIERLIILFVA